LDVAQGEKELRMIFVEDLVGDSGAVDTTKDLDKGAGSGKKTLEKSSWDVIAHELYFVLEATLYGCCEDSTDSEQEEVVISGSSIRGISIRRGRSDFHSAETGGHSFEAMICEELVLEEAEEPKKVASDGTSDRSMSDKHLG